MSKKTFNDVKEWLDLKKGYKIEKDPAYTVRRYIIIDTKKNKYPIRYIPTMTEMYAELEKIGVDSFIDTYRADTTRTATSTTKTKKTSTRKTKNKTKNINEVDFVPNSLKNRKAEQTVNSYDAEIIEAPENVAAYSNITSLAEKKQEKLIDFNVKVPKVHNNYYFPNNIHNIVTRLKLARNIFLVGDAGTGKSELPQHLGHYMGAEVVRINFNIGTTEQHLIGKFVVKDGQTKFVYGLIPLAMMNGWWIILDEIDYAQPEHLSALQSVLEGNPLIITQNENEAIYPHENFRVFATGNTKGRGDESQSYAGTNFLNMAFLDRWSVFEISYTTAEAKICKNIINDGTFITQLTGYFKILRKISHDGELGNVSFSTRRLIQICEVLALGETLKEALEFELFSRYEGYEINVMKEAAYDIWDRTHYFGNNWKIGDEHIQTNNISENNENSDNDSYESFD